MTIQICGNCSWYNSNRASECILYKSVIEEKKSTDFSEMLPGSTPHTSCAFRASSQQLEQLTTDHIAKLLNDSPGFFTSPVTAHDITLKWIGLHTSREFDD